MPWWFVLCRPVFAIGGGGRKNLQTAGKVSPSIGKFFHFSRA
jgi:hypothetical protein